MGFINLVTNFIISVVSSYLRVGIFTVDVAIAGFRAPLAQYGLNAAAQTFVLALVPILTMAVTIKFLSGVLRVMVVASLFGALVHITWPMVDNIGRV